MRIYAIKDEVIGFTGALTVAANDEQIQRMVAATVLADDGNQMSMWPKDFSAWEIGELDKVTGHIKEMEPRLICRGNQFLKKEKTEE